MTNSAAHRRSPVLAASVLAASLALAACNSSAPPSRPAQEPHAMTDTAASPYTDQPVEARLGPHRFKIPANYFDTQLGPDFQGNMRLILQWPDLQPLAPGERYFEGGELRLARNIDITPDYIDRVPLQTSLERALISNVDSDQERRDDPALNPDLRIHGAAVAGLTPYYTDFAKVDAYQRALDREKPGGGRPGAEPASRAGDRDAAFNNDWFVGRDANGTLTTVIKCTARELPDGAEIDGDTLRLLDAPKLSMCSHDFTLPGYDARINVSYLRVFMKDWRRIEQRIRGLFEQYHTDSAR